MTTKHLYDSADGLVLKSLRGAVALNPSLRLHSPSKTVYMCNHSPRKHVAVISGGGSGHEPAHAGYTGTGMLSAAVAGDIFASPSAKQILATIKLASLSGTDGTTSTPRDVLAIINNYTGDRLNFGLAIEKARVDLPSIKISSVIVADDVSLLSQNASNKFVGPRGLGANILVCKVLGALAETGASLEVLKAYGDAVVENLFSLGVGLDHCHVPGRTKEGHVKLGEMECEVGLGLHNEPGVAKREIGKPGELVRHMLETLIEAQTAVKGASLALKKSGRDGVVVFINNLGGISQLEMGAVVDDVVGCFAKEGVRPRRIYCSAYMTSLNAPGFSISILDPARIRHSLQAHHELSTMDLDELLDAPTAALAWVGPQTQWQNPMSLDSDEAIQKIFETSTNPSKGNGNPVSHQLPASKIENAIRKSCQSVLRVQDQLTEFDTIVGDGDCGETFGAGANAVLTALDNRSLKVNEKAIGTTVGDIANILEDNMGGTIGAFFAIFLFALSNSLTHQHPNISWPKALQDARHTLSQYTPAEIGDRTFLDALAPFCDALTDGEKMEKAVWVAKKGAESTRGMKAHLGRAAYMSSKMDDAPPDPGAWGVWTILEGLAEGLRG
ncbi:hypothetical protein GALMADRAFT_225637 [Galerina marginata CBS 339.88]|uniref:Dihydroxyacetone kinase n=1 Tax=Galerina marginata (strain CBS 339.88) TaxID=685588 RepID=A0A067T2W8_GALM3|nr:hypothetical protein GALMADRAFT_225637 [Galerina marginata CBS 339.88]